MSFKCKIGFHTWDGCTCSICGKIRNAEHNLSADCSKCSKCGTVLSEDLHDWSEDCERCAKCGKIRENKHSWQRNCEKCSKCGKVRSNMHQYKDGICQVCGHGTFHDETDGLTYNVIKIGDQVIMAQNLARKPSAGKFWAYDEDESNRAKFGYLYDWEAARSLAPPGWHLPTKAEWETLYHFLGGKEKKVYEQLKADGPSGFNNVFGGERYARGAFNSLNASANYWSDTQEENKQVWELKLGAYTEKAELKKADPRFGFSVRLFRNK